ncbi:MAG: hypothetical protein H0V70_10555 [Ktedonobacteraceae bacterium]|nr:hypothetical protein [Ktedonobacteraceae bacterium]
MSSSPLQAQATFSFTSLWRSPTLTIARFMLKSHIRSGWILGDIVFIWFLYAAFFYEFGGDVAYFYGTMNEALSALAVLSTIVMTQRAMTARMYLPLSRLSSRSAYIGGLIIATAFLRVPSFLLTLLLALGFHRHTPSFGIQGATFSNMLPGAIGLLLNTIFVALLTIVLYRPLATRLLQIIFLLWCVAMLYSNTTINIVAQYLSIVHLPLIPITVCYSLGTGGAFDIYSFGMVLVTIGYTIVLAFLANFLLNRRDLILH